MNELHGITRVRVTIGTADGLPLSKIMTVAEARESLRSRIGNSRAEAWLRRYAKAEHHRMKQKASGPVRVHRSVPVKTLDGTFAAGVEAGQKRERQDCLDEINKWIKLGDLPGNGCDQTAQNNGMILASNLIMARNGG